MQHTLQRHGNVLLDDVVKGTNNIQSAWDDSKPLRLRLGEWIDSRGPQIIIATLIIINAITIGLSTSETVLRFVGPFVFEFLDYSFLAIFTGEVLIRFIAYPKEFFKNGWNWFDVIVIIGSLLPLTGHWTMFRVLRVLRLFRIIRTSSKLKVIVETLIITLPSLGWIMVFLLVLFYIFGLVGTVSFGADYPAWFGNIGRSMYTLFQVMTLESWSMGICRPIMQKYPWAFLYFIPFILLATYTIINLFVAIIVNTMQAVAVAEQTRREEEQREMEMEQMTSINFEEQLETEMAHKKLHFEVLQLKEKMYNIETLFGEYETYTTAANKRKKKKHFSTGKEKNIIYEV
jgi:voltage-gated sodium channel